MTRLPEFVILVTSEGEWNTTAWMGDHPNLDAEVVNDAETRKAKGSVVHVLKVPLAAAAEIDAVPQTIVPPTLRDRS